MVKFSVDELIIILFNLIFTLSTPSNQSTSRDCDSYQLSVKLDRGFKNISRARDWAAKQTQASKYPLPPDSLWRQTARSLNYIDRSVVDVVAVSVCIGS